MGGAGRSSEQPTKLPWLTWPHLKSWVRIMFSTNVAEAMTCPSLPSGNSESFWIWCHHCPQWGCTKEKQGPFSSLRVMVCWGRDGHAEVRSLWKSGKALLSSEKGSSTPASPHGYTWAHSSETLWSLNRMMASARHFLFLLALGFP